MMKGYKYIEITSERLHIYRSSSKAIMKNIGKWVTGIDIGMIMQL